MQKYEQSAGNSANDAQNLSQMCSTTCPFNAAQPKTYPHATQQHAEYKTPSSHGAGRQRRDEVQNEKLQQVPTSLSI